MTDQLYYLLLRTLPLGTSGAEVILHGPEAQAAADALGRVNIGLPRTFQPHECAQLARWLGDDTLPGDAARVIDHVVSRLSDGRVVTVELRPSGDSRVLRRPL